MRWGPIVVAASIFIVFVKPANAQPAGPQPAGAILEADVIIYDAAQQVVEAQGNVRGTVRRYRLFADSARYDLRTGIVVAAGRIRLVDPEGRELRGGALTYNTRTEEGFLEPSEGRFERRVYLRGSRLDVAPERFVAHESTLTTCDPQRPFYRIIARRIEIIPNEAIIAEHASVYLGNVRLVTLPRLRVSFREGGPRLPGFGVSDIDGYWVDYRLRVRLAGAAGDLYLKYGTLSGPFALLTLNYGLPRYSITTRLGRTQTLGDRLTGVGNLLPYDVAEVSATTTAARIGSTPFSWSVSGAAGWYAERLTGVSTLRLDTEASITSDAIPLAPNLSFAASAAFRVSAYGTGLTRTITTLVGTLSYGVDRFTTLGLGYTYVQVGGTTPLAIDVVNPASTVSLGLTRAVPDRYRIAATLYYNTLIPEASVQAFLHAVVSPRLELGLYVDYSFRTATFFDIDYTVRWICDCIEVVVRYRQIRREFFIEFGLPTFTERGAPFVPRTPPPSLQPPP